jgi:hypothetical protein
MEELRKNHKTAKFGDVQENFHLAELEEEE